MKILRIAITKSRTINLGDYNSKKAELTLDIEVNGNEDYDTVVKAADIECNTRLKELLDSLL